MPDFATPRLGDRFPEPFRMSFDHAQLTANSTVKLYKVPAGRKLRIDRCAYINPTGLAENASNAFAITVQNGATVIANGIDTDSDEAGDNNLAADTFVEMTLSATDANRVLAAADILSLVFTEDGTAILPAGRLVVEGRLI